MLKKRSSVHGFAIHAEIPAVRYKVIPQPVFPAFSNSLAMTYPGGRKLYDYKSNFISRPEDAVDKNSAEMFSTRGIFWRMRKSSAEPNAVHRIFTEE